ncbi:MAG TPA: zf-HC2 domain-containing protein [Candidatus Sabulitectum sp.]|nr:zf-HC2 domain-containing protein [Candidatus Sabulitectum sp.]HRW78105.1 zf-HC2 domain-containing protein [Candidatus Sabulitectum sp.]
MKCEDALLLMDLVIDGEAGPEDEQLLRFHINGCPSCRKAMLISQSISQAVDGLEEPQPPDDLLQAVTARLASGNYDRSPIRPKRFLPGPWKAAAVLPFAAAAILLFHGGSSEDPGVLADGQPALEETVNYTPAPVMAYSRPSSVTSF